MQSSDFIKVGSGMHTPEESGGGRMVTTRVVVGDKEYFKKQIAQAYGGDLRLRMALYKEFNVGNQIDSPYIVRYKAINEDEDGLYVLMEHINGMSVAEKMEAEPAYFANTRHTVKMLRQLLQALKALHSRNTAYLDLKPENIMLTQVSNDVRLVDLGGCFADSNSFTAERTNSYAAPELANDQIDEVDARTDIYGVGRLMQYIEEQAGCKLPQYLQRIKQRCLNEDKTQRYESADAMLKALNRKAQRIRGALCGIVLLVACAWGWQWYTTTEHYRRTALLLQSDALIEGIYYAITSEDSATCKVIGLTDWNNLYIRERVRVKNKEYAVTEIGKSAFEGFDKVESVNLPKELKVIGEQAFYDCASLVTVTLPEGFTELRHACFKRTGIRNVSFPKSLKSIGHASFAECQNITELLIPEGVETLELDAFACCQNLARVQLPSTLKTISRGVFWDCPSMEQIHIPSGVREIGEYAFANCKNLSSLIIPSSVKVIGEYAFDSCKKIKFLTIEEGVTIVGDGVFCDCEELLSVEIPTSLEKISSYMFGGCKSLSSVAIPDSVYEVGNFAFEDCSSLRVIDIPDSVDTIGRDAFPPNTKVKRVENV